MLLLLMMALSVGKINSGKFSCNHFHDVINFNIFIIDMDFKKCLFVFVFLRWVLAVARGL